jgi:hypothetical protein
VIFPCASPAGSTGRPWHRRRPRRRSFVFPGYTGRLRAGSADGASGHPVLWATEASVRGGAQKDGGAKSFWKLSRSRSYGPGEFDATNWSGISFRKGGLSALAPHVQPHELAQHADHAAVETTRKYYLTQTVEHRAANTARTDARSSTTIWPYSLCSATGGLVPFYCSYE